MARTKGTSTSDMDEFNSHKFCYDVNRVIYENLVRDFSGVDSKNELIDLIPTVGVQPKDYEAQSLPAHKSFLRAVCPTLKIIKPERRDGLRDLQNPRILFDCDRQTLLAVREFIYTGNCNVTVENFSKLCEIAEKIEMESLQRKILDFKDVGVVTEGNWLQLLRLATFLDKTGFISIIYSYLKSNSPAWIVSQTFKLLTFDEIYAMLTSENRPFPSHSDFHKAILVWLADSSDRCKSSHISELQDLLDAPKSPKIESSSSNSSVGSPGTSYQTQGLPDGPPASKKFKKETKSSSSSSVSSSSSISSVGACKIPSIPPIPRLPPATNDESRSKMLIFLVKPDNGDPYCLYKLCFNGNSGEMGPCVKLADLPVNLIRFRLVAITPNGFPKGQRRVFMFGGINRETDKPVGRVWGINLVPSAPEVKLSSDWALEPRMRLKEKPGGFEIVVEEHSNTIYMLGGQVFEEDGPIIKQHVSELDLDRKEPRWVMYLRDMEYTRERFASTILNNVMYMAGGHGRKLGNKKVATVLRSFEMLDLNKDWKDPHMGKTLPQMSKTRVDFQLIAFGGKIWALGGLRASNANKNKKSQKIKDVEIYDPETGVWCPGPEMNYARSAFASFEMDGHLYVVGGNDVGPMMERFDLDEEEWTVLDLPEFEGEQESPNVNNADFSSFIFLNNLNS